MKIVIFGANGQTGRLLTRQALDAGHNVVAVTRKPHDFPLSHDRLTVAKADVRDAASLQDVVDGADAVLSALGVTFTREKVDTYSVGTANVVSAMRAARVQRLVVVSSSAIGDYPDRTGTPIAMRFVEPLITRVLGKTVYQDMRAMEAIVTDSGLRWTIVRPSGLFDQPQVTDYLAGQRDPVGAFTSRADLADYLLALAASQTHGDIVTISTIADTPTMWDMIRREAFKSA